MSQNSKEIQIYIKFDARRPTNNKKHNIHLVKFLQTHIDTFNKSGNVMNLRLCDENDTDLFSQLKHKHGIKRLPVLTLSERPNKIYGVDNIKKKILSLCRSRITSTAKNNDELVQDHQAQCMRIRRDRNGNPIFDEEDENEDNSYATPFDDVARAAAEWQRRQDQFNQYDGTNASGRRNIRNDKRTMNHRGPYGEEQGDPRNRRAVPEENDYNGPDEYDGNDRGRIKMRDNPADIQRTLPGGDMRDNDLMTKFWENNEETQIN